MKNYSLCIISFFVVFLGFSNEGIIIQEQEQDEINANIEQFLSNAEKSINEVNFDDALTQLNTALELSKSIEHQRYIALSSSLLAQLYFVRHDHEKAATALQRAVSIQREIDDQIGLAYSYVNYAKLFTAERNEERTTEYLDLAEDIYTNNENIEGLGIVALNRAILAINIENNPEKALQLLQQAQKYIQESESSNDYEKSRLHYYLGRSQLLLNNSGIALTEAKKAFAIAQKNSFGSMAMTSSRFISQIYEVQDNYQQSLLYLKASNKIRDSIFNLNKEALASDADARYGVDVMKNNLSELSQLNAEQERSLKVNKLTTILSVALITILSLLTLSLYKNNNLRARANDLLQKKNTELVTAKENAEKASMAKAQFLSTITHELRTPLYSVTGLTHLLLEESPTPNQKEHLNSLKFSGEYLLSLINNILDLNKLEAKKVEMHDSSFNLKKRISDVLIALKNSAEDKKTKLHLDFEEGIPKKLKGDPLKISQILINLIGNAIKFTENGDIWVRVKKISQKGNNVHLRFEIEDNGVGIGKEKQKAIFENFTQGSLQINRKFGGTGLGLSIVKNLLTLMNSEIHLE
ncbi:MAG TPA: ATP-binding protein, partial [Salinimicrobium sp.]|nr:ATP-binding protein [Salinimicrobium sp.]